MAPENTLRADVAEGRAPRSLARHVPAIGRVLLGLVFFGAGAMGFLMMLGVLPPPKEPLPERAGAFAGALMGSGYLFPLLKTTELVGGALLLSNRLVPLALALLAPVVVNIFAFHAFLAPSGVGLAAVLLALEIYLAWAYRGAFRPMLAARVAPER